LLVQVAEQPFGAAMLYPAVGLHSAGEEVRLIGAAELWGIDAETETETRHNNVDEVCICQCYFTEHFLSVLHKRMRKVLLLH